MEKSSVEILMDKDPYEFRVKNHKPLKFGTSGLRALDSELTDLQVFISTKCFINYLLKKGDIIPGGKFALAGDFRPSTKRLLIAVSCAIIDSGIEVIYCGRIPTPAVSYFGFKNKIPSAMITASHNPYGQNGVKFNRSNGEVLKDDESQILEEIKLYREEKYKKLFDESMFTKEGFFKDYNLLNSNQKNLYDLSFLSVSDHRVNKSAYELFVNRYKDCFGDILAGEKLVFYQQTAVGREIIPEIFEHLGAKVICEEKIDESKTFIPVDTEDMREDILEKMAELAYKNKCFICVTADGDSDRPAVLFLRKNEKGEAEIKNNKIDYHYIKGDKLNVLSALFLKPDFFAAPMSFNHKALNLLRDNGVEIKLTKVGSPYVIKTLNEKINSSSLKNFIVYGCEVNGGALLGSDKILDKEIFFGQQKIGHGKLEALPTRDSVLPIICSLILAKKNNTHLEKIYYDSFSGDYESYSHAGLVENIPGVSVTEGLERYNSEFGKIILDKIKPLHKDIIELVYDDEIIFFNHSNNLQDFRDEIKLHSKKIINVLQEYIHEIVGTNVKITKINFLDGIRIYLSNEEIIHFRASGNSAQFRIYVEANNFNRAYEIVKKATSPKEGVLIKLINDFIDGKIEI